MIDILSLYNVISGYGIYTDQRNWEALTNLFATEVHVDYTAMQGGEPSTMKAIDLVEGWKNFLPGFTGTSHLLGLPNIELNDDEANAELPFTASHVMEDETLKPNNLWAIGGRYRLRLKHTDNQWLIISVQLIPSWQSGNLNLPKLAAAKLASHQNR
ncbi:MAG: nuclear transport factor 2 family protein [Cyanobacteria bacterium P01_H01_bin.153]